ncbi:cyclopropane-fatty-acyl-phospholipid synthase [Achromobacter xylosoxidans]|uniref:SAM-dependent methyltransferase n=1 Tax=Achromobacter ruhlandii TaxID=72557 RepID=UPI00083A611A|nr:cyclopropane-fatty-acyl-phospholipid synthase family protein [Achromobacter ruhlandii]OCZ66678.1 cyclopropane-fatty-acyl-phospholipid synthase [Achromobacter xylosoxidans]
MTTATLHDTPLATDRPAPGLLGLAERGLLPDALLRLGMRRLCAQRLAQEYAGGIEAWTERDRQLIAALRASAVAIHTDAANTQHYELPTAFFQLCLGARMKYSSCYYPTGGETLDQAEAAMLRLYGERAELADGQDILELGCGWGSLTLWMAEQFPNARITAVSNSATQRQHIEARCRERGWSHVRVVTSDVNVLSLPAAAYDRCVSVEMFEHMRNYQDLLARIAGWLRPGGKLFVHIFAHRERAYPFETEGADNWMGRHFFTGGIMPSAHTLLHFQHDLRLQERWFLDGTHYARTANHWLANQDARSGQARAVLEQAYGAPLAGLWHQRWRMFWMACAELFGYEDGQQWGVAHYRFERP